MNRPMRPPSAPAQGVSHTFRAALVIVLVVAVGWVLLDKGMTSPAKVATSPGKVTHPKKGTTTTLPVSSSTVATTSTTTIPAGSIKLQVLNGVGTGSLAGEWSTKLRTRYGYDTLTPDNAKTTGLAKSVIYVMTPGYQGEADTLATTVGLTSAAVYTTIPAPASVVPVRLASEASNANLVLVVGSDLAGTA